MIRTVVGAVGAVALAWLLVFSALAQSPGAEAEENPAESAVEKKAEAPAPQADDDADDEPMIDPLGPNSACYVCHTTFVFEELSNVHLPEEVTCVECHGLSAAHANDENIGATPPDITFERSEIDASCVECHEEHDVSARDIIERFTERELTDFSPVCTDCHGTHKIEEPEEDEPDLHNPYEEEAIAGGEELGIGSAGLEGPESVEVMSHGTWTLVYTAGKAGIRPGGGIRIGMRHLVQWSTPQTKDPKAEGFLTVKTTGDAPVTLVIDGGRFFSEYFAWQNMVEVVLPERGLAPGETIRVTYGDRSQGSPGTRVQPFDESRFVFKVYVDALGQQKYLPLGDSPAIEIVAAQPYRLAVVMPSDAVVGEPTRCTVRVEDRYGNPAVGYRGAVQLQSTDAAARLPEAYTFTEADRGAREFEDVVFATPGSHTITAGDGSLSSVGNPVRVAGERPERLLLWGDLHGHTLFSDGRGTVEEYYDFARRFAALDFCAVSDHAFELVDAMWEHSKKVTNGANEPGRFVTFNAYEWSGNTGVGGDHNVYFLEDDPPLFRSDNYYDARNLQMYHGPDPKLPHVKDVFAKLEERLKNKDVFCVPHYGGRRGNPEWHSPKTQRLIEIFSEHRRSEDWATEFLTRGRRLGVIASTDNHYGNPGYGYLRPTHDWETQEIGMAAVAVYAASRTRESIFHALYDRHAYATSGDRIILDFRCDGHPMGSEYRSGAGPTVTVEALGTAAIARVEIKKASRTVAAFEPGKKAVSIRWKDEDFVPGKGTYYYVRVVQTDNEEAISSPVWVN